MAETPTRPPAAQLSKSGSISPSVRRLFSRYPPAIIDDTPIPSVHMPRSQVPHLTPFERRFPEGYKVADASIPLFPDEVPPGYEQLFSPKYTPVTRRVRISSIV
jgi:hypothetical protein